MLPPETPTRGGSRDGGGGGSSPLSILIADDLVELYQPVEGGVGVAARKALEAAAEAAAAAAGCSSAPRHIQLGEQLLELAPTLRAFVDAQQPRNGLLALMSLMREIQAFEMWTALGGWAEPAEGVAKPSIGFDLQPRLDWARATSSAPALSTEEALDRRGRARKEVQSAMHTLLGEGNLLCFIPVAAPPPFPVARQRPSTVHAPSCCKGQRAWPRSHSSLSPRAYARRRSCHCRPRLSLRAVMIAAFWNWRRRSGAQCRMHRGSRPGVIENELGIPTSATSTRAAARGQMPQRRRPRGDVRGVRRVARNAKKRRGRTRGALWWTTSVGGVACGRWT